MTHNSRAIPYQCIADVRAARQELAQDRLSALRHFHSLKMCDGRVDPEAFLDYGLEVRELTALFVGDGTRDTALADAVLDLTVEDSVAARGRDEVEHRGTQRNGRGVGTREDGDEYLAL